MSTAAALGSTAFADASIDPRQSFAAHLRHVSALEATAPHRAWTPDDALARGDVDELAAFRLRAPGLRYAHPTVEHVTPLFVTLGAATDPTAPLAPAVDGLTVGLPKRSFSIP